MKHPRRVSTTVIALLASAALGMQFARAEPTDPQHSIRLSAVGSAKARPDTVYVLMKVESGSPQLAQAIRDNTKQVSDFMAALAGLGIPGSDMRVSNFVVAPMYESRGVAFSRNVILTIPAIDKKPQDEVTRLLARIQDLGAKYGSSCVTCIGSG
jgi:uncharacterized protein YggE